MGRYDRQSRRYPRLARRARRQGRIATGPDRRAAGRQIRHIKGQRRRQIGNIQRKGRGAARSAIRTSNREAGFERGLAQNVKGVATPGLTRRQLTAGAAQVKRYGKGLATISRRAASQDVRGVKQAAREDIYSTKESVRGIQHQATAEALAGLVQNRRQTQRAALQEAQQNALDKIQAQRGRSRDRFQAAYGAVGDILATDPVLPQNEGEWRTISQVAQQKNPEMSPHEIEDAINRYRTHQLRRQGPDIINYWRRILGL